MRVLFAIAALPVLLSASFAQAPDKPDVPKGLVQVDVCGQILIYAKDKALYTTALKTEVRKNLQAMQEQFSKQYGLEKETLRVGMGESGLFKDDRRGVLALAIFASKEDLAGAGLDPGAQSEKHEPEKYRSCIGVAVEHGGLTTDDWVHLWHQYSHAFFQHVLIMGEPLWLNEGLAEYFAYFNRQYKPADSKAFVAMIDRIRANREDGKMTPVRTLLTARGDAFKRQQQDEAFVLVHFLFTGAAGFLNDLTGACARLEGDASGAKDGVMRDLMRFTELVVPDAFGGVEKLQAAYDKYVDDLLAAPESPKKVSLGLGDLTNRMMPTFDGRMDPGMSLTDPATGVVYTGQRFLGNVTYRAPWPGTLRVVALSESKKGDRSEEVEILPLTKVKTGQTLHCDNKSLPFISHAKWAVLIAVWSPEGGGEYRTERKMEFRR